MPTRSFASLAILMLGGVASGQSVFAPKKAESIAIPMAQVTPAYREAVKQVLEKPTLSSRSAAESFPASVEAYRYFLDRPDRAVAAWRKLGAKCVSIQAHGKQTFSWSDEHGSEVVWRTVLDEPEVRVWFAEGKVKPAPMLPVVPVKVVVVLRMSELALPEGKTGIQHHTEMAIFTDSKTALVVTKMLGPSSQRMAEQALGQFQFFFGGLSFYLSRHPDQVPVLLRDDQ